MKLTGIFPAVATPFDHRGEIYVPKIHHNVSRWNLTAVTGYVVASETGEGSLLTADEKVRVWEEVGQAADSGKLLLAATGAESVRETLDLTRRAAEAGYQAAVVAAPRDCPNPAQGATVQRLFYRSVADEAKIPIILSIPSSAQGVHVSVETVAVLAEHPNIFAVHDESGDVERLLDLLRLTPQGFPVLAGSASTLYPCLTLAASGAILALANAAPYTCLSIEEAVRTREYKAAHELQDRVASASFAVTKQYGIPGLKYAMDLQGYYGGTPRLPLSPVDDAAKKQIEEAFREIKS